VQAPAAPSQPLLSPQARLHHARAQGGSPAAGCLRAHQPVELLLLLLGPPLTAGRRAAAIPAEATKPAR